MPTGPSRRKITSPSTSRTAPSHSRGRRRDATTTTAQSTNNTTPPPHTTSSSASSPTKFYDALEEPELSTPQENRPTTSAASSPPSSGASRIIGLDNNTSPQPSPHASQSTEREKKRGPYGPRKSKEWKLHFKTRQPRSAKDGSVVITTNEEPRPKTRRSSRRRTSKSDSIPGSQAYISAEQTSGNSVSGNSLRERILPVLEFPYLQEAFPYEQYQPSMDRPIMTSFESLADPLSPIWYRPQGLPATEDIFSSKKLSYATEMLKKIKVDTAALRMDIYFQRGFDMAARRVLDRIRAVNHKEAEAGKAREAEKPEEEARDGGSVCTPTTSNSQGVSAVAGGSSLSSSSSDLQQPSSAPTEPQILPQPSTPASSEAQVSMSSLSEQQPTCSSSVPRVNPEHTGASGLVTDQTDATMGGIATTTTTAHNATVNRSRNSSTITTNTTKESSTDPSMLTSEACKDPKSDITLADYYQANTYLASLFQQPHSVKPNEPVSLGPGACQILQTLLMNLETKVTGMGCHLQRAELTRRLAKVDTVKKRKAVADTKGHQHKLLKKVDPDEFIFRVDGLDPDEGEGEGEEEEEEEEEGGGDDSVSDDCGDVDDDDRDDHDDVDGNAGVESLDTNNQPFVSNPLKIPDCMDPFMKARDYLQTQDMKKQ